jgi:SAM-dependent methyltransferase
VFLQLAQSGALRGRVLDAGCGTGEHALLAAAMGLDATGIDTAAVAIARAPAKARERGRKARFLVGDALNLAALREQFDAVLDCGLFHVLDDADRGRFVESLGAVLPPGGRYWMLCFSDQHPGKLGPRHAALSSQPSAFSSQLSALSSQLTARLAAAQVRPPFQRLSATQKCYATGLRFHSPVVMVRGRQRPVGTSTVTSPRGQRPSNRRRRTRQPPQPMLGL